MITVSLPPFLGQGAICQLSITAATSNQQPATSNQQPATSIEADWIWHG